MFSHELGYVTDVRPPHEKSQACSDLRASMAWSVTMKLSGGVARPPLLLSQIANLPL